MTASTSGAGIAPVSSSAEVGGGTTSGADQNVQASATSAGLAAPTGAVNIAALMGVGAVMGLMVSPPC